MKLSIQQTFTGFAFISLIALQSSSASVLISDFEPPTYTNNATFIGVDFWATPFGGTPPEFKVTPDTDGGSNFVIAGTQSAVVQSSGFAYKSFANAGVTSTDMGGVSWLQGGAATLRDDGAIQGIYIAEALNGLTPFGIFGRNVGGDVNIWVLGGNPGAFFDTGIEYVTGGGASALNQVYEFSLTFNFTTSQMSSWYRDVTGGGSMTSLFAPLDFNPLLTSSVLASDYGVLLRNFNVSAAGFDNIAVIPEPSTGVLLCLGGALGMAFGKRSRRRSLA